ncbi:MAG: response regulator [Rubrivivax sp.]|nr:response regulator [Rubrivivax sp.]
MTPSEISIVHIDDESSILSALRRALVRVWPAASGNLKLRSFTSAAAALGTLLTEPVDAVICDYRMPEMDGVELLRRVRELQPHTGRILLSGATDLSFLLHAVNQAAVARVLRKPWVDEELLEAVRNCVALRRLQLENADLADQVRVQRGQISQQDATLRRYGSLHPEITEIICSDQGPAEQEDAWPSIGRQP